MFTIFQSSHVQWPEWKLVTNKMSKIPLSRCHMFGYTTYNLRSMINVSFPPGFSGNSRAQNPSKAQKKWANITRVQYFCRLWSGVYAWINRNGVNFILSCLSSLHPHNLPQLHFSPPPFPEYTSTIRSMRAYVSVQVSAPPQPLKRPTWRWH